MKKLIKKKTLAQALNEELKEKTDSVLMTIEEAGKEFSVFLEEHLQKFDSLIDGIIKIELSAKRIKEDIEIKEQALDKKTTELGKREKETDDLITRVKQREVIVDEENTMIKKKKKHLETWEHELSKKDQVIKERTKHYKTATPIKS